MTLVPFVFSSISPQENNLIGLFSLSGGALHKSIRCQMATLHNRSLWCHLCPYQENQMSGLFAPHGGTTIIKNML
jgi:hypothetical protein